MSYIVESRVVEPVGCAAYVEGTAATARAMAAAAVAARRGRRRRLVLGWVMKAVPFRVARLGFGLRV
jgi:hypothetical protein